MGRGVNFKGLETHGDKDEDVPFDKDTQDGPLGEHKRRCTDVVFTVLISVFAIGMLGVSIYGFVVGDPVKLLAPTDDDGNFCGHTDGYG